jgi:hypothetical protein
LKKIVDCWEKSKTDVMTFTTRIHKNKNFQRD